MGQPVPTPELSHSWLKGFGGWLRPTFVRNDKDFHSGVVVVWEQTTWLLQALFPVVLLFRFHLEVPCPCYSSSTVYSSLILAKGLWRSYSLSKGLIFRQKDPSRRRILHQVFYCARVTANCSQYPKFLWHVVNGTTALLFRFELELKSARLVDYVK